MTYQTSKHDGDPQDGIAIVGMAARLPGADTPAEFWANLCNGRESISRFAPEAMEDSFGPDVRNAPEYVRARPILEDVENFDAAFFGMHAREAELTDPQHRVFLECCWQALEDAGYDPARYDGAIGVFAGSSMNTYFLNNVCAERAVIEEFTSNYQLGKYTMLVGASQDFLATRVAYKLNLRGPAVTVQTACSTSLLAVAQACQSLLLYQSDMVLAGGVSITFPQKRGYLYQEGGMASRDGHCRTFDADASGTIFGSGAGVVVLKRLEEALADGDHIYAVIKGSAVNNDGAGKVGFTAPSVDGQATVIATAQAVAGVDARSIGYVECHGTATPLGDPIEFAGLLKAFRTSTQEVGFCALGSAKSNVGHLDAAAGVTGLIKAALALKHGQLPPTLHFRSPNPRIDFASSPFFVNASLIDWPQRGQSRRAGVSAFGVGGTNVHVVVEEPPTLLPALPAGRRQLLLLSARSESALVQARAGLAAHLRANPGLPLEDVAYTLQLGRQAFAYRSTIHCATTDEAAALLATAPFAATPPARESAGVAFMFPGQGSQYQGMGGDLYRHEAVYRRHVDECADILQSTMGLDLRPLLYGDERAADRDDPLRATCLAQPAIFVTEYALARLWMAWGLQPCGMVGHSIGEFVAACVAGVIRLEDALDVVAARGRLMQALPPGGMLAVRLPEAKLLPMLGDELDLAAVNGPSLCVAAGPLEAIAALEVRLGAGDVMARRLHTSHAFHSRMMDPAVDALADRLASIALSPPTLPYVSTVTGDWIRPEEATSPTYWARHCRLPVRFAAALATLARAPTPVLLEVGPGRALTTLASQILASDSVGHGPRQAVLASLPDAARESRDDVSMCEALGRLWTAGVAPDWTAVHAPATPHRVSLPTYPFERKRHWIDAPRPAGFAHVQPTALAATECDGRRAASVIPNSISDDQPMHSAPVATVDANRSEAARIDAARSTLVAIFDRLSGEDLTGADDQATFLELGFDSLFLGQVAQQVQARFGVKVTFRQLLGDLPNLAALSNHLASAMPPEPASPAQPQAAGPAAATPVGIRPEPLAAVQSPLPANRMVAQAAVPGSVIEAVLRDQLEAMRRLMSDQLEALRGIAPQALANPMPPAAIAAPLVATPPAASVTSAPTADEAPSRFQVYRPVQDAANGDLTEQQRDHISALSARYTARTAGSKRLTQRYRQVLADPRAAAGFRAEWKEMVYPIVSGRSKGSKIWDVDGNEYIDLVNGYGQTAFGHAPDFMVEAVSRQLHDGFAIGPQSDITGEVATLFCELTGNERATFCNTGSEAVMAAMRLARAVTGRNRVAVFGGAYHGQFDEVLVKGGRRGTPPRALPIAPGILAESLQNMVVLPYADPDSLAWVREHAGELAAVIAETVQSRHPALQPREFLAELRTITEASGTALVFDEVVTGFRMHPGGMQALFDIRADMATYGKVVGGGMPVGVLAGKSRFMDALDGGMWQYGDDSYPEVAPTFFAGTFVRHPLTLAALKSVLLHLKAAGPALQERLTARTAGLVERLNAELAARGLRTRLETFGSLFYFAFGAEDRLASLLYYHLRLRGIHIQEGFPCFLTTAHSDADLDSIVRAFKDSLDEMIAAGVLHAKEPIIAAATPALPGPIEVPLTEPQTEIWLAAQLGPHASCSFNESVSLRLQGSLDDAALIAALNDVVARHDVLRARFSATGDHLTVAPQMTLAPERHDLSDMPETAAQNALQALLRDDAQTPFDLVRGPAIRAHLIRLSAETHVLVLTAHHIVCDGWSFNVIVSEIAACYTARRDNAVAALPPALQFSTYARQQASLPGREGDATESYWLGQFASPVPPLDLPSERSRPAMKSFEGATYGAAIDAELYRAVKKAGARQGCTLFVTLLAAFQVLAGRLAGQQDVVVAIPSAGQSLVEDQVLVGHCVNLLPLRGQWSADTTFSTFLKAIRQTVLDAYEHQSYTFGTLVRRLALTRDPSRLPLVQIQFNLEKLGDRLEFPELVATVTPNPKCYANFDLFLNVIESDSGLRIDCDYSTDLFDEATIERWIDHYRTVLSAVAADAARPVATFPIMSQADRAQLLTGLNATATDYPAASCVHMLFEAQAARSPDAVAAAFGDATLSYRELDCRANRLANHIRARVPGSEARIGVLVDRSADMLVSLLAVLKAGHAYVPLDTRHPSERLRLILADAEVAALIATADTASSLLACDAMIIDPRQTNEALALAPDTAPAVAVKSDQLAYVIYTSGSTGTPKGVAVTHRSVVNFLCAMASAPGLHGGDVFLAVTTIAFDIAGLELFLPLSVGARVEIAAPEEVADGFALLRRLQQCGATALQATPSTWQMLLDAGFRSHPAIKMLCGGEKLSRNLADKLLEGGGALWNMYGPTETTIWSSTVQVMPGTEAITVGLPIANTTFHIIDGRGQLAPLGASGELWIGGDGLAREYFRRPELTAEKFVFARLDDAATETRFYRTGDVARRLPNGRVQVLGRSDQQIKLRGFRIELGEIEETLGGVPGIAVCAVVLDGDQAGNHAGAGRLVAYYVEATSGAQLRPDMLRHELGQRLPDYMVPALWVRMECMPLNANGKIDRRALPQPDLAVLTQAREYVPAQAHEQQVLASIWQDVLQVERIGLTDNLFELGADSIHLFQITARSVQAGITLTASQLLKSPTIGELSELLARSATDEAPPPEGSASSLRQFARSRRGTAARALLSESD